MYSCVKCFSLLAILTAIECGVLDLICVMKERDVFQNVESIPADYVQFRLYTRNNTEYFNLLTNAENIGHSAYNPNVQTIFIMHGYESSPGSPKIILLKEFLLLHGDFNVIVVDWSRGASKDYMPHAIRNAFASAREVKFFIELLMETSGTLLNRIHLIGFSLGAQLASFVGKQLNKVGRITALDPAGPCFSRYNNNHRIHYTDAEFVDVIMTNADGMGMKQPAGHVNFIVNGGMIQPECAEALLSAYYETFNAEIFLFDGCSHARAIELYTDSLKSQSCQLTGYSCSSYQGFLAGECGSCGDDGSKCAPLGYKALEYKTKIENETKIFYLKAGSESPYCLFHYAVSIKLEHSENSINQIGVLYITLEGSQQEIQKSLTPSIQPFEQGEEYHYMLTVPSDIGYLKSVKLLWIRTSGGSIGFHGIRVDRVNVSLMNGDESDSTFKPCGKSFLTSGVPQRYFIGTDTNDECSENI